MRTSGYTRRRRRLAVITGAVVALVFSTAVVAPASAEEPERDVTVAHPGPGGWEGTIATGLNQNYDSATGEPCGDGLEDQCDTTLLRVDVPAGYWDSHSGGLRIDLDNYFPNPGSDFDLYIYESDASGTRGSLVDLSGDVPGLPESAEIPAADGYYLVQVVYFAVTESRYTATAEFFERPAPAPAPPDVDDPPGLQDVLASDPSLGFRSRSEPHIAQNPVNPEMLIAGSKFYNRDPDSLAEYEFKVGTYVSFDGGRSWSDLGQTAVCPSEEAPPESWPTNTCYPDEDPNEEGTGVEDGGTSSAIQLLPEKARAKLRERHRKLGNVGQIRTPAAEQRGGDFGEEYITSDPWVGFDDEGNAYLMLLDSPPFDHASGWGMSFHRWETPTPEDVESGNTWSEKIPISSYDDPDTQPLFLDDKNTFAVNNAGPDGDGQSGPMVACWGQNIPDAIKQQTVCKRSTDGGLTWPGPPIPISPPTQQLVIGVSVVADNVNPDRFYATWLHYTPEVGGLEAEYWSSQSLDGGLTWTPATFVTQVQAIPRQFPGQRFRNLSIPISATGPNEGEIYTTYAEYREASSPDDEDGMQADVMLISSDTGGLLWSEPQVVNGDGTDADQFQPNVAVTPSGQINLTYFDRRHDPDNLYIDTYLSRSNDGGETFTDVRVSHDMWDPRINPPISSSGDFIGDYQGLVADDCTAIPFFNDTHLANDAGRDSEFDDGLPRSQFQEVFSWRIPNTAALGGEPAPGVECGDDQGDDCKPGQGQGQGKGHEKGKGKGTGKGCD